MERGKEGEWGWWGFCEERACGGSKDCALRAWDGVGRAEKVTIYT